MQIIAIIIFLATIITVMTEKVHRAVAAVVGALLLILTGVLTVESGFSYVDINTIGVLIGPMTLAITNMLKTSPVPFFITQIMSSNIGGTATLIGDPPNIMIGSAAGLSFADFIVNTGPVVVIILAVVLGIFFLMYRGHLHGEKENMEKVLTLDEN